VSWLFLKGAIQMHPTIREERPGDEDAIRRINELAFGQPGEAELVDELRKNGGLTLSLVAVVDEIIVGHIAYSPVVVGDHETVPAPLALAPMAVLPTHQRNGVGTALVRESLEEARRRGHGAVLVLGHPEFYPRFGFTPASRFGITCPYPAPDEAFLAVELVPGALQNLSGMVQYRPEFGRFS
jgi:putative acetyltransferase